MKKIISVGISIVVFAALLGLMTSVQSQPVQPYTVQGYVYDTDGVTPVDGVNVIVTELNTSDSVSSTTAWGGFYYVTFGWPQTGPVYIGDQLQIFATYDGGNKTNTTIVTVTGTSPQIVDLILEEADTTAPRTNVTAPPIAPGRPNETTIPSGTPLPWTNKPVTLWFFRTDNSGSGVAYTNLSLAAGSETESLNVTISNESAGLSEAVELKKTVEYIHGERDLRRILQRYNQR